MILPMTDKMKHVVNVPVAEQMALDNLLHRKVHN